MGHGPPQLVPTPTGKPARVNYSQLSLGVVVLLPSCIQKEISRKRGPVCPLLHLGARRSPAVYLYL
jgi:hypothetical protein